MEPNDVIIYPVMTEVASRILESENKLVFVVNLKASKTDVKRAVEELYEVR
jgi:large subunit ribosomal protein L23